MKDVPFLLSFRATKLGRPPHVATSFMPPPSFCHHPPPPEEVQVHDERHPVCRRNELPDRHQDPVEPSAQANSLEKGTTAGGGSISSTSSTGPSSSTCTASTPESVNGDGDSGGSDTSDTGVSGCMWGGDHLNSPHDTIIFHLPTSQHSASPTPLPSPTATPPPCPSSSSKSSSSKPFAVFDLTFIASESKRSITLIPFHLPSPLHPPPKTPAATVHPKSLPPPNWTSSSSTLISRRPRPLPTSTPTFSPLTAATPTVRCPFPAPLRLCCPLPPSDFNLYRPQARQHKPQPPSPSHGPQAQGPLPPPPLKGPRPRTQFD